VNVLVVLKTAKTWLFSISGLVVCSVFGIEEGGEKKGRENFAVLMMIYWAVVWVSALSQIFGGGDSSGSSSPPAPVLHSGLCH
jgi:hypothetical protein